MSGIGDAIAALLRRGVRGEVDPEAGARDLATLEFRQRVQQQQEADARDGQRRAAREAALAAWRASKTLHDARVEAERGEVEDFFRELGADLAKLNRTLLRGAALPARWAALENGADAGLRTHRVYRYSSHFTAVVAGMTASAIPPAFPLGTERPRAWPALAEGLTERELAYFAEHIVPHAEPPT